MKRILTSLFAVFIISLISCPEPAAQGIRFNLYGLSYFERLSGSSNNNFYGFGYEHNIGEKISVSLEYNKSYSFDEEWSYGQYILYDTYTTLLSFQYNINAPWSEFAYQSKYFFSDNDESSWYIGSGIALRTVKFQVETSGFSYSNAYAGTVGQLTSLKDESITLIPLMLRLGYRNELEGLFGDYYLGVTYIPGASSKGSGHDTFDELVQEDYFNSLVITLGLSVGFGWAD